MEKFGLYRILPILGPKEQEWLCYTDHGIDWDQSLEAVRFNFANAAGHQAKFLSNGMLYFPVVGDKYLYYSEGRFSLQPDNGFPGRVFLYMPPGKEYSIDTNLAGMFFVAGNSLNQSRSIWTSLGDQYYLGHLDDPTTLSQDCIPNCAGKTCNQDNGCGLPCGCPNGRVCLENGTCGLVNTGDLVCPDNVPCGSSNGQCFGNCPFGYQCVQTWRGKYFCQRYLDNRVLFGLFIFLIVVLIATAIIVFGVIQSHNSQKTPESLRQVHESKI